MIEEYTASIYNALIKDLSDVEEDQWSYSTINEKTTKEKRGTKKRRPYQHEIEVVSFPQTWSSTALGFGGIGGQAFTTALTVAVLHGREACVYFGGSFAYKIDKFSSKFYDDMRAFEMADVRQAHKRYEYK